jgi:hypothetical protein
MKYTEAVEHLDNYSGFVKEASIAQVLGQAGRAIGGGARAFGQGLYNIAFGGQTQGRNLGRYIREGGKENLGKWNPLYGLKTMGKERLTYKSGPLKGNRMVDPVTGNPVIGDKYKPLTFLKQEWQGSRPKRSDYLLSKITPKGKSQGQFMEEIMAGKHPRIAKELQEADKLSVIDFMKKYPGRSAQYYGLNVAQKGFVGALPAIEVYDNLAHNQGAYPDKGRGENLGATLGEALGYHAGFPLGWVGAPLLASGLSRIGRGVGSVFDDKPPIPLQTRYSVVPTQKDIASLPNSAQEAMGYPRRVARQIGDEVIP